MIQGKTLDAWYASHPVIQPLVALEQVSWFNPAIAPAAVALGDVGLTLADVKDASARLLRFAPYLAKVFPQTAAAGGIIESAIQPLKTLQQALLSEAALPDSGALWLKKTTTCRSRVRSRPVAVSMRCSNMPKTWPCRLA